MLVGGIRNAIILTDWECDANAGAGSPGGFHVRLFVVGRQGNTLQREE